MWIVIRFPSGCCFALLRPDAVPFGFLRRLSRLFLMFLKPLGVLFGASWDSLGSLLEPLGAILGRLGAKLGGLGATFEALRFFIIFPGLGVGPGFSLCLVRALGPLDRTGSGGAAAD